MTKDQKINDISMILNFDGENHARYNLEGVRLDLTRIQRYLGEVHPSYHSNISICMRTINRVIEQLAAVEAVLDAPHVD